MLLPANTLVQRSRNVVTGRSSSRSESRVLNSGPYANPRITTRETTHTKLETYFLCGACENARRARRNRVLLIGFFVSLAVAYWGLFGTANGSKGNAIVADATSDTAIAERDNTTVAEAGPYLATEPQKEESLTSEELAARTTQSAAALFPDITVAVEEEIQQSLREGVNVAWHWRGMRGQIIPSEGIETTQGICRNLFLTLETPEARPQSEPTTWCKGASEKRYSVRE